MTTTKTQSWLWPDRRIYKRESRVLREEHNALVNLNAELLAALEETLRLVRARTSEKWKSQFPTDLARWDALIAKAKGGESQ